MTEYFSRIHGLPDGKPARYENTGATAHTSLGRMVNEATFYGSVSVVGALGATAAVEFTAGDRMVGLVLAALAAKVTVDACMFQRYQKRH